MQFKSFKRKQINLTSLLLLTRIQDSTAHCVLNDSDQHLIRSTWNLVKRHSNQGPKAFLRHFDAKAAASSTQRSYDHPEGGAFISQASNCLSRLSFYLQQQQEQLGGKKPLNEGIAIKKCPALAKTLGKYNGAHREVDPFEFHFDMQMTTHFSIYFSAEIQCDSDRRTGTGAGRFADFGDEKSLGESGQSHERRH